MVKSKRYDNDYPSCSRTYATLCIYHASADPRLITEVLQLNPDETRDVGELIRPGLTTKKSLWFLRTKDFIESKDFRTHIDWLLDQVSSKKNEMWQLYESGYDIRISCFWGSAAGNGGPFLDHELIKRLSEFPVELDFDIWFEIAEENHKLEV